jgi:DNA polymerase III epsilon subunit-like protein
MIVFDCETDGLLDQATKVHVLSWSSDGKEFHSTNSYKEMRELLASETILVGHNICRFDVLVLEKILGISIKAKLYDTLPMSWVMYPQRQLHGLESFGEDFGVPKPEITDWEGLTYEQYKHRCEEDVKINWLLWKDLIKRFKMVYKDDKQSMDKFFQYLTFKMKSAAMAEQAGWRINKELVEQSLATLEKAQEEKVEELRQVMPPVTKYAEKTKPEKMTKKDGTHSKAAIDWFNLLEEHDLPLFHEDPVRVVKSVEQPNPNSSDQVKDWLFSMGWEPCTHDYKKNEDGTERMIPQVRKDGELAPSVKLLIEKNPGVGLLDGLTVIQHRKSIFEGMLESEVGGYVKAEIAGLTNTLRFKHKKPLVNLPGVDKPWGKEIRGSLIADEGTILCGADMVSLEATTKRHFIFPYDPEYVAEMSVPGFDEHLDLAVRAGYINSDDYDFYTRADEDTVNDKDRFKKIKKTRKKFKPVNYSAVYGVGVPKLSRTTGMSPAEAKVLLEAYWERNWAVRQFAKDQEVKTVNGQMWVKNPVNGFWYTLRYEKDIFSTLNQGTGAYCFDQWVAHYLTKRPNIVGQFHDESINRVKRGEEKEHESVLRWAINKVNEKLKLNIKLDIDVQFGVRYADIH